MACFEFSRRKSLQAAVHRTQIRNSRDIYELFHSKMGDLQHEECWALYMNNQHRILDCIRISQGGLSETTMDPKIILRHALNVSATAIVVCHNHPSDVNTPSLSDDKITKKLINACSNMDIQLTDHIIYAQSSYYSYADDGKL